MPRNLGDLVVELRVPAHLFAKNPSVHWSKARDTNVRKALDKGLGICLGRCKWRQPAFITCTFEQFGFFVMQLTEQGCPEVLDEIDFSYRRNTPPEDNLVFDLTRPKEAS